MHTVKAASRTNSCSCRTTGSGKKATTTCTYSDQSDWFGIQFDPVVVDAFVRCGWLDGVADLGADAPPPRRVPLIGEVAAGRAGLPAPVEAMVAVDRAPDLA